MSARLTIFSRPPAETLPEEASNINKACLFAPGLVSRSRMAVTRPSTPCFCETPLAHNLWRTIPMALRISAPCSWSSIRLRVSNSPEPNASASIDPRAAIADWQTSLLGSSLALEIRNSTPSFPNAWAPKWPRASTMARRTNHDSDSFSAKCFNKSSTPVPTASKPRCAKVLTTAARTSPEGSSFRS